MTVEIEKTFSRLGGLIKERSKRVAEYRFIEERKPNMVIIHQRPESIILHQEPSLNPDVSTLPSLTTFAHIKSEDSVEVYDSDFWTISNTRTLVGDEINQANLVDDKKRTRLIWRETMPGDYPEPPEGQVVMPRQLEFNLR